ncbi:hypothetical protein OQH61_00065 [Helicobacter sp. MIT 21-1697]|uniref:hypothetical protein n=1 Tax=Helicobacter sp. MIT 21-1697 TaxID=2993733 RepID=UPI00224A9AA1|nr:hypothetical protein [Helicobacter sp. MIT 21-1697]MCX2716134.1 hypothetical protein [Helicobacter sp. MIT 21-1697]
MKHICKVFAIAFVLLSICGADEELKQKDIQKISNKCLETKGAKICNLVYADLLLRTNALEDESELNYRLSSDLDLYVSGDYKDERALSSAIKEYVHTLHSLANTGLDNWYCKKVAQTFFIKMANEQGVDIHMLRQQMLLDIWASKACGLKSNFDTLDLNAIGIDKNNIAIGDMVRCEVITEDKESLESCKNGEWGDDG